MKKRICILYTGGTIGMVPSGFSRMSWKRKRLRSLERRVFRSAPCHPGSVLGGYARVGRGGV